MPIYSHSQLSMYEGCPLKYKLRYRDKIKRDSESIEGFRGTMVHETLKKCYDNLKFTGVNTLSNLLTYYNKTWRGKWHDSISIMREELTQEDYRALGEKMIKAYYERYSPFDSDITIGTEMNINFSLDDENKYRITGFIDRLSRTQEDVHEIHDYKTSAYLPGQEDADTDRQLGLYHLGVQRKWPHTKNIRLIWHYLAFDTELISYRSPNTISNLVAATKRLIDEIESAQDFSPKESWLCEWCEYPDLCPLRKHFFKVETLAVNEYLNEPGVMLVNKYVALKNEAKKIDTDISKVKEAMLDYAIKEEVEVIKGSDYKARIRFDESLKFPGKNDAKRQQLEDVIREASKWTDVSQLDTTSLAHIVENSLWSKDLIDKITQYGRIEASSSVHMSKLGDEEK